MVKQNKCTDSLDCEVDPAAFEDCALRAAQAAEFDKMLCGEEFNSDLAHDWPAPTPRKEDVLSSIESDIPNFVTNLSDFKEIVYGVVAYVGSEALSKQNDSSTTYRLHMLKLLQDQAVHDCAGVWLRREGRQCLRISIDNIMHVYMEWVDVEPNKETNADKPTHS